ncbi:MAG TPA: porin family protein [Allosphingosinicella sp.]
MRNIALAAVLAGTVFATPTLAQETPQSGFRIEGVAGYDRPNISGEHANGVTYGLGAGYDFQAGRAIVGVEGEATDSSADRCASDVNVTGDRLCVTAGRDLYVGGRVGAQVAPNVLLYAKAGYSNAWVGANYEDGTAATLADFRSHRDLDGVRGGAGVQVGIGRNAYVKTEYRYSNYQDGVDRNQVVAGFGFRF